MPDFGGPKDLIYTGTVFMKSNFVALIFLGVGLTTLPGFAEILPEPTESIVVSPTKTEMLSSQAGSSVYVVRRDEIERRKKINALELLRDLPGVDVVQSGPTGGDTSIFIRGANSEHTLVLIDGIEVNDPITPNRTFNFANLLTNTIDRIEILRGPQSTLYGSDAIGGVIHIFTRRGESGFSSSAQALAGSFDTFSEEASVSVGNEHVQTLTSIARLDSSGISAAATSTGAVEDDGYQNTTYSTRVSAQPRDDTDIDIVFRFIDAKSDLDNSFGIRDDPNRVLDNEQLFARASIDTSFFDEALTQIFSVSLSDQEFKDRNDPDELHPLDISRSRFSSRFLKFEIQNEVSISEEALLVVGVETEEERGSSKLVSDGEFGVFVDEVLEQSTRTDGLFAQVLLGYPEGLNTSLGIRVDDHDTFGSEVTYRIAPTYSIDAINTRVFGSVGTGFKAPTLFQLFSSFGNPDLRPEESLGVDFGFETTVFDDQASFGATFFHNEFDDLVDFDPNTFLPFNIAEARSTGVEAFIELQLNEEAALLASYTLTDTKDEDTGEELLRRPRSKARVSGYYTFEPFEVASTLRFVGSRDDNDFSTEPVTTVELGSYVVVDMTASFAVGDTIEVFTRIDNIFDRSYQDVLAFGTKGIGAYGGVTLQLG